MTFKRIGRSKRDIWRAVTLGKELIEQAEEIMNSDESSDDEFA